MRPDEIWRELERDPAAKPSGVLARRLHSEAPCDLWLAVERPRITRQLLVTVPVAALLRRPVSFETPALRVSTASITAPRNREVVDVVVSLLQSAHVDLFSALVLDLMGHLATCTQASEAAGRLVDRLSRWQHFFRTGNLDGLTEEEQRGLFGELSLLRSLLIPAVGARRAAYCWVGPLAHSQDFQLDGVAIESKCTGSAEPLMVEIHGARQLDDRGLDHLLLHVLAVDVRQGAGETLNALVDAVRSALDVEPAARARFESCLFDAGYLDAHSDRYERLGYAPRREAFFTVVGDRFPRITERTLPAGIGNLRYSVSLDACAEWKITQQDAAERLQAASASLP